MPITDADLVHDPNNLVAQIRELKERLDQLERFSSRISASKRKIVLPTAGSAYTNEGGVPLSESSTSYQIHWRFNFVPASEIPEGYQEETRLYIYARQNGGGTGYVRLGGYTITHNETQVTGSSYAWYTSDWEATESGVAQPMPTLDLKQSGGSSVQVREWWVQRRLVPNT